jgi:GntR family transcriptional regulator, rspAB operon transcriptional repressor
MARTAVTKRANGRSSANRRPAAPPKTLAQIAYEKIKERLVSGHYLPGQFLQETFICDDLDLGRTPIHQGLHRLQQEGILDIIPRKGILVRVESISEILTALEVRSLLEPFCTMQCAERANADELKELAEIHTEYKRRLKTGDKMKLMEVDREFHSRIAQIGGNYLIVEFLRPIHERMSRLWFLPHWQSFDFDITGSEHEAIMRAIESRAPAEASKVAQQHIDSLRRRILPSA